MGEIPTETENQEVIHRNMDVNEKETNVDTFEEVIHSYYG